MAPIPKTFGFGLFINAGGPTPSDPAWMYKFNVTIHFWKWNKYFGLGRGRGNVNVLEMPNLPPKRSR